jgi:hypothetical protein
MTEPAILVNPLLAYPDQLRLASAILSQRDSPLPAGMFEPGWDLDCADPGIRTLLTTSPIRMRAASFEGARTWLLDLMTVDGVRTTKAWPSLLMVARAVTHIRSTGESVLLVTPTSGNKGSALRYAVGEALAAGLVTPDQLRIVCVVPRSGTQKIWHGSLDRSPDLARLNPLLRSDLSEPADVKRIALEACLRAQASLADRGTRLWYTLDIRNYQQADAFRAFAESRLAPATPGDASRVHVHAVSSAFGLLGYEFGREVLARGGQPPAGPPPRYLIVQHLRTPDMVLHWQHGSFDRANVPPYAPTTDGAGVVQSVNPWFPALAATADEEIDPTFYTKEPATSALMTPLLRERGIGGIVVSGNDCAAFYPKTHALCSSLGVELPGDLRELREWSLVMAVTGMLIARERGFAAPSDEVVIHGSGSYSRAGYQPVPSQAWQPAADAESIERMLTGKDADGTGA